jgi:hypothetical protein
MAALPTASGEAKAVGKEAQLCQQLALPTALPRLLAKLDACFRGSPSLPTAWPKAVGKAGKAGEENPALPTALAYAVGFPPFFSLF